MKLYTKKNVCYNYKFIENLLCLLLYLLLQNIVPLHKIFTTKLDTLVQSIDVECLFLRDLLVFVVNDSFCDTGVFETGFLKNINTTIKITTNPMAAH
jgi:hypothetical protein